MKKRLLSAALALAMVLTLLPFSAMPAFAAVQAPVSGSTRVTYYERIQHDKLDENGDTIGGSGNEGWYYSYTTQDANGKNVTRYAEVTDGVVNNANGQYDNASGTWYSDTQLGNGSAGTLAITSFTLIDDVDFSTTRVLQQSINVDVNGKSFSIGINDDNIGKVSSINIYDKQYSNGGTTQGTFNETAGITSGVDKALNVKIDGAKTGVINLTGKASYKVEVVNKGTVGSVTLGASGVTQMQTVTGTNATMGQITVFGDRSHVNLTGVEGTTDVTGPVAITGSGAHLTLNGAGSQIGAVTLASGLAEDKKTGAAPYVEINGGSATSVAVEADDKCTSEFKVTVNQGGTVGGTVDMSNAEKANVTVNSGTITGLTTVKNGKVTVSGSYAKLTNGVTLGASSKETELKVEGSHHTIGTITITDGTAKVTIPADPTNNFTDFVYTAGKVNHGIAGGTWTTAPAADYLVNEGTNAIRYTLTLNGKTTLYTASQLGEALTAQKKGNSSGHVASVKGQTIVVTFKDGDNELGTLKCNPYEEIALPSLIDGRTYSNWMDGTKDWGLTYSAPDSGPVELNAKNTSNSVTKINGLTATTDNDAQYLTVGLSGTQISLSGAVKGSGPITIKLDTDMGEVPVTAYYEHSTGKLSWANQTGLVGGMSVVLSNGELVLQLSNKTEYTLRNAGIKVPSTNFTVNTNAAKLIVENISSSAAKNDSDRTALKTLIGHNNAAGKFEWSGVPAIEQAINTAKAGITDNQVTSWIQAAQREAFTKNSTGSYDPKNDVTGYDTATLVPYLGIDVTDYKANGSITMKLTLKYRIEVTQSTTNANYQLPDSDKYPNHAYIAYTGTLGNLSGDMSAGTSYTKVTFAGIKSGVGQPFKSVHQDGTYVYGIDSTGVVQFNHPGTTGLGTIVIDDVNALVTLYDEYTGTGNTMAGDANKVKGYYDTIQAAVDNTEPKKSDPNTDTDDYIEVAQGYANGNVAISVTGKARQFYIRAIGSTTITSTTSGGVLITPDSTGHLYTVKLNEDTVSKGNITIASSDGGSASVSANPATVGSKVTITLNATAGYTPSGVSVKTASGQTVSVSGSGSSYTFTMPSGSVTVTPSFSRTNTNATVSVGGASSGTGTASTNASGQVAPGTLVTVTTNPGAGQRTMGLTVTGATAVRTGTNTFQFSVPSGYANVVVTPKFDANNGTLYEDVWSTEYYSNPVRWAVERGITNGQSTYRFGTGYNCTREDMVTFLWRAAGSPVMNNVSNPFWDVQAGSYYYNAVLWAVSKGITNGVTANQFGVGQPVTRAQTVTFLYRYNNSPAASTNSGFYDVSSREYYAKAVSWANAKGVTNGTTATTFSPNNYCPREQIVTFLYRDITGNRA